MGCWNHHGMNRWQDKMDRMRSKVDWWGTSPPSSGNRAFDEYRADTLRRLEEEQREFKDFLQRLRFAKDRAEFDQFMAERRNRPDASQPQSQP
jgi:DNA modification methylase